MALTKGQEVLKKMGYNEKEMQFFKFLVKEKGLSQQDAFKHLDIKKKNRDAEAFNKSELLGWNKRQMGEQPVTGEQAVRGETGVQTQLGQAPQVADQIDKEGFFDKLTSADTWKYAFTTGLKKDFKETLEPAKGAIAHAPVLVGNTLNTLNKVNPVRLADEAAAMVTGDRMRTGELDTVFKDAGQAMKKELQEKLNVDPDSTGTKMGEFLAEMAPLIMGGGLAKGAGQVIKTSKYAKQFPKVAKYMELMSTKTPGAFKSLISNTLAGVGGAEFEAAFTEGRAATGQELIFGIGGELGAKGGAALFKGAKGLAKKFVGNRIKKFSGLTDDSIKKLLENPQGFKEAYAGKYNLEGLQDQLGKSIETLDKDVDEAYSLGAAKIKAKYGDIDMKDEVAKTVEYYKQLLKGKDVGVGKNLTEIKLGASEINEDDIIQLRKVGNALETWMQKDSVDIMSLKTLKQRLNTYVSYTSPVSKKGALLIKDTIHKLKESMNEKIPEFVQLNAQYAEGKDLLTNLGRNFVQGGIKPNLTLKDSTIRSLRNLTNAGNEARLARVEKIMPGIGEKIKLLKVVDDYNNANKPGTYLGQVLSAVSFGIIDVPGITKRTIKKAGSSKKGMDNILSTVSKYTNSLKGKALEKFNRDVDNGIKIINNIVEEAYYPARQVTAKRISDTVGSNEPRALQGNGEDLLEKYGFNDTNTRGNITFSKGK